MSKYNFPLSVLLAATLFSAGAHAASTSAPPCAQRTLDQYVALGSTGCSVGQLTFMDFSYGLNFATNGAIPLAASDITVNPVSGGASSLNFTSPGFRVTGQGSLSLQIFYTIDPPPDIIRGYAESLDTQTPVFPGIATVRTDLCIGARFNCAPPGQFQSLFIFSNGTSNSILSASTSFPETRILGVRTFLELDANGASSDIRGFGSTTLVSSPEPGTSSLLAASLVALWALRMRAKKR